MILLIDNSLDVYKRVYPTLELGAQSVEVEKEANLIHFRPTDRRFELTFSLDELRAIMRLFDVSEDEE